MLLRWSDEVSALLPLIIVFIVCESISRVCTWWMYVLSRFHFPDISWVKIQLFLRWWIFNKLNDNNESYPRFDDIIFPDCNELSYRDYRKQIEIHYWPFRDKIFDLKTCKIFLNWSWNLNSKNNFFYRLIKFLFTFLSRQLST
jgi:hypothetical protein